jgi:hypothetical protein
MPTPACNSWLSRAAGDRNKTQVNQVPALCQARDKYFTQLHMFSSHPRREKLALHFTKEETEAQRGRTMGQRPQDWGSLESESFFNPKVQLPRISPGLQLGYLSF